MNIFPKTLFQGESKFNGDIKVIEHHGQRKLIASGYTQSNSLDSEGKTGSYWDKFVTNVPSLNKDSRILILGLAGGTIAKIFTNKFGAVTIDGVEIDPMMVDLGKKYFNFNEKNVNIIIADAFKFVKEARYKYDVVAIDLYVGGRGANVETEDFLRNVKALLTKNGVVVINRIFTNQDDVSDFTDSLKKVFQKTENVFISKITSCDNVVVYAYP